MRGEIRRSVQSTLPAEKCYFRLVAACIFGLSKNSLNLGDGAGDLRELQAETKMLQLVLKLFKSDFEFKKTKKIKDS